MKKILYSAMILSLAFATSCKKDKKPIEKKDVVIEFTVLEAYQNSGSALKTKVQYELNQKTTDKVRPTAQNDWSGMGHSNAHITINNLEEIQNLDKNRVKFGGIANPDAMILADSIRAVNMGITVQALMIVR
jgi:hypothetical protein